MKRSGTPGNPGAIGSLLGGIDGRTDGSSASASDGAPGGASTDAGVSRRKALRLFGLLGTAAVGGFGTVGRAGATGVPAQQDEAFDPTDTDLAQWGFVRNRAFDTQTLHERRRLRHGEDWHQLNYEGMQTQDPPLPYVCWSWPEIVRNDAGTVRLRPSEARYHSYVDPPSAEYQTEMEQFYNHSALETVDRWTSRQQLRFDVPTMIDVVDVMYLPHVNSWRYTFVAASGGSQTSYRGSPDHAHEVFRDVESQHDRPVVHEHAMSIVSEGEEELTFITSQTDQGLPHAFALPWPQDAEMDLDELEDLLAAELPDPQEAGFSIELDAGGLVPTWDEAIGLGAGVGITLAVSAGLMAPPVGVALTIVIAVGLAVVKSWLDQSPDREIPDQVDEVVWEYEHPKSYAHHFRTWSVDVPAAPDVIGQRASFEVKDRFELEQPLVEAPGASDTSTTTQHLEAAATNPTGRTIGTAHVTLPVLEPPESMSAAAREHNDVRPYCHDGDSDDCLYKAFGVLPDVSFEHTEEIETNY